jgi:AcrR family transcriptional regulator
MPFSAASSSQFAPLPRGRHGLNPELVSADQQARIHAAIIHEVAQSGYLEITVESVTARAGVSRRAFYELYGNREECFLAACEAVARDWWQRSAQAYQAIFKGSRTTVRSQLRAGLKVLVDLVVDDPLGARVLLIELLNCAGAGLELLEREIGRLQQTLERALGTRRGGSLVMPRSMMPVLVGGVLEVVTIRLRQDRVDELPGLIDPLSDWMLSYRCPPRTAAALASERARLELAATTPGTRSAPPDQARTKDPPLWRDPAARPAARRDQRARILDVIPPLVAERGYAALTAGAICEAAACSHQTFRRHFVDAPDAFLAAYRAGNKALIEHALVAYEDAGSDWQAKVRAGLEAELGWLAAHPAQARIGFVEVFAAGPQALELRETELHMFTAALEPGFTLAKAERVQHPVVAEAIAGGIYRLIRGFIVRRGPEGLACLAPDAQYAALAPFKGTTAAAPPRGVRSAAP